MERPHEIFQRTLRKYNMVQKQDAIFVAVSGGPDSIALFDLFYQIRADWQLDLHLIHLNHCLRGEESDKDATLVEQLARDLKMPLSIKRTDVDRFAKERRLSIEEAGREARLQFFREEGTKLGIRKVALGHHRDDQAETVLLRILRGTGLRGLTAIKPVVNLRGMALLRPLLEMGKKEIESYIRERRLPYRLDASNEENRFLRNKIRHTLIPELERHYNPRIKISLANLAETVALDLAYIEEEVESRYPRVLKKRKDSHVILHRRKFLDVPEALRFRLLQRAVKDLDPESDLDYSHWDEFRWALEKTEGGTVNIAHEVTITVGRKEILLKKEIADETLQYQYQLSLAGGIEVREAGIRLTAESFDRRIYKVDRRDKSVGIFDLDRIRLPIMIRNRREGDRFRPLGMKYDKKLKDFLIGRKVPNFDKNRIPLFVSNNDIFWVYGVEISDHCKVTNRTRRFLKITTKAV